MKKIIMVIICLFLSISFVSCTKTNYDTVGKDTHDYFGDARFAILLSYEPETPNSETLKKYWCFRDRKGNGQTIDKYVRTYKKVKPYVYVISSDGYTKVNYEDGNITKSKNLNEFSKEEQEILKSLEEKNEPIYK